MDFNDQNLETIRNSVGRLTNSAFYPGTATARSNDWGGTGTVYSHEESFYLVTAAHVILASKTDLPDGIEVDGEYYYFFLHGADGYNNAIARLVSYNADAVCEGDNTVRFESGSGVDRAVLEILNPKDNPELIMRILEADTPNQRDLKLQRHINTLNGKSDLDFSNSFRYRGDSIPLPGTQENTPSEGTYITIGYPGNAVENGAFGPVIKQVTSLGFMEWVSLDGSGNNYRMLTPDEGQESISSGHSGSTNFIITPEDPTNGSRQIIPDSIVAAVSKEENLGFGVDIGPAFDAIREHALLKQQGVKLGVDNKTPSCHLAEGELNKKIDTEPAPIPARTHDSSLAPIVSPLPPPRS